MTDFRTQVTNELLRLEEDMLYTEKGHFAAANELSGLHLTLGLVATISAAASVASIVADGSALLSGVLALVAAITSAVLTFVKPEETAAKHLSAARLLGDLRVQARQHRELDLHDKSPLPEPEWADVPRRIRAAKAEIDQAAPSVSDRRFNKAQKKIQSGDFTHDSMPTA